MQILIIYLNIYLSIWNFPVNVPELRFNYTKNKNIQLQESQTVLKHS